MGDYLSQANENTAIIIQIETLAAYQNVEALAKIQEIGISLVLSLFPYQCRVIPKWLTEDVLFVGPFDLSNALGHPLAHGVEHPVLSSAIQRILDVAHSAGKKAGIFTTSNEDARKRVEQGFDMVHIGTDVNFLINGITEAVTAATGKFVARAKSGY